MANSGVRLEIGGRLNADGVAEEELGGRYGADEGPERPNDDDGKDDEEEKKIEEPKSRRGGLSTRLVLNRRRT